MPNKKSFAWFLRKTRLFSQAKKSEVHIWGNA